MFLDACADAGAMHECFRNPRADPQGEPLHTDVALLGRRDARNALVLCSGTHGVEGFAGSAIQTGLLREGIGSRLGPETSILMIHAINPFGFAHLRRANEDNVDLNRNFIDHTRPHPASLDYDALADILAPTAWWPLATGASIARLLIHRITRGKAALQAAITGGQYTHPQGLFYG